MKSFTKQVLLFLCWIICLFGIVFLPNVKLFFEMIIGGIVGYSISFVKAKGDDS